MKPRWGKRPLFKPPPASLFSFDCLQPTLSIKPKKQNDKELQKSPVLAKKLWNFLRVAYFMMKKGIISKRKLLVDMNMMMRKRGKHLGKTWGKTLIFQHRHNDADHSIGGSLRFGLEYEFSCSDTPSPAFFRPSGTTTTGSKRRQLHHHIHFPCINKVDEDEDEGIPTMSMPSAMRPSMIEYSPQSSSSYELTPAEALSPQPSPLSVRISNYSSEDEGEGPDQQVDVMADDFIKSFYERLRAQCRVQLLEYQEMEYHEMLARGAA